MAELSEKTLEQACEQIGAANLPVALNPTAVMVQGPYIAFYSEVELLNAAWSLDGGRTVEFRICGHSLERIHPFKRFTQRRGGRAGTMFIAAIWVKGQTQAFYHHEGMLAAWGDNSTHGQHFKLWLDEEPSQHPFAGFTRRKAQEPGDLFTIALVELDDDGSAINQEDRARLERAHAGEKPRGVEAFQGRAARAPEGAKGKTYRLSQSAHLLVTRPAFVRYLTETKSFIVQEWTAELARKYVKEALKVESLSQLDRDPAAARRFHELIRRPYEVWFYQDPGDHP